MTMTEQLKYDKRGVSASKREVHEAIKNLDKGLFPNAFCKILPDLVGGDDDFCNIMHADTAGTKTSLAYMYWKETGDISVWKGIVQDAIVMNLDDMACVGCVSGIVLSSTVGRNRLKIPQEVISAVINGTSEFLDKLKIYGIDIVLAGGETADVGDIVRTIDIGFTAFARLPKSEVVNIDIRAGDVIVGFSSFGKANYENEYNGGMGSNGLTSARHDVFHQIYRDKYPECYDPNIDKELVFSGTQKLDDKININGFAELSIGKLVLSPTRTYLPVIKAILDARRSDIHGMIHCTGGAQTKVGKFISNKKIVKDRLFPIPPLFDLIEKESGTGRKEMYQVFNMGHRLEIYTSQEAANELITISKGFGIDAKIIGYVEASSKNEILIKDDKGEYQYFS
jgi:phosphoribosylformylglycinamidine cyclo-ligase